ncbi:MAG: BTAD domain-containing putative transcriptional regulator [Actinomycetota bacterium]
MEFRILGPLEVVEGNQTVTLGGSRERALLALLLLSPNEVVSSDRLIDDIWGDRPSPGAIHTLRVTMSRLRKALGVTGGEGFLVTRAPGYLARVGPAELDTARFAALVARGRDEAARGDHERAATTFSEALGLWRGPALADLADGFLFARVAAGRLEETRLSALEERIDADLARGRHRDVLPELEALTRTHPLRERLWGQRMLALYRAGRQAEALRAYQELRTALRHDLGIEPHASLQRLETAILRHQPELELAAAPPGPSTVPVPSLLTDVGRIFVGRDEELKRLQEVWDRAASGAAEVALIGGEPGIGKTRLAAELAGRVHAAGAVVLAGRCDEDLAVPYQPFVEALRHAVEHTPAEALPGSLGRHGGELVRLLPDLLGRAPDLVPPLRSDPETERYRLFDAVAGWLASMSADRPVLLLLDDLQWAAKPTLLLLRHVAQAADPRRLLIVGLFRDTDLGRDNPLFETLADLRRQGRTVRISLAGLDRRGVEAFMEAAAGHVLDADDRALARVIHDETAGNPFFVAELLRHLVETGAVRRQHGRWRARPLAEQVGIPDGVRDVVRRRLSRLTESAGRMLAVAAVIGPEFDFALLRAVAGPPHESGPDPPADGRGPDAVLEGLDETVAARLVVEVPGPVPRGRFAHALVRATLYDGLTVARRLTLHRRVAEAIEAAHAADLGEHLPALAHHYARAAEGAADIARAVDYAVRAGDRALAQLANDEAVGYYQQALGLLEVTAGPGDDRRRLELLIALGEAQRRAGDPAHRDTLLEAGRLAARLGNADAVARAALANQRGMFSRFGGVDTDRVVAFEEALAAIGPADTAVRARLLGSLASELYWANDLRRHEVGREALAIARRLGDAVTLAETIARVWLPIWDPAGAAERAALADELEGLASETRDPVVGFQAGFAVFLTNLQLAHIERATAGMQRCRQVAEQLGQPVLRWLAAMEEAHHTGLTGHPEEARRLVGEARRLGEAAGQPDSGVYHDGSIACIAGPLQGRFDEALALAAARRSLVVFRAGKAWFATEMGHLDEARTIVDELRADNFALVPRNHNWFQTLGFLSRAAVLLGDRQAMADLYDLLLPNRSELTVTISFSLWPVAHELGLLASGLGHFDDAERHFADATEIESRIGARSLAAHTQLEWGRMLLVRGQPADAERARTLLVEAAATARDLGLGKVERDTRALLLQ